MEQRVSVFGIALMDKIISKDFLKFVIILHSMSNLFKRSFNLSSLISFLLFGIIKMFAHPSAEISAYFKEISNTKLTKSKS